MKGSNAIMRRPKGAARFATAARDAAKGDETERLAHQPRNLQESRPALGPAALTHHLVLLDHRRKPASSSVMAWSATSSMKVSGMLVTGMPRAVAALMSRVDADGTERDHLQFSSASMTALVIGMPLHRWRPQSSQPR